MKNGLGKRQVGLFHTRIHIRHGQSVMASAPENAGSQPPRFPELRSPAPRPRPS
jgi:hypothetical protein